MSFKEKSARILSNDWGIGLLLLGVFLSTNGYLYAWDDQHLEIPLLKSLIDPQLYPNDYYVDSLKKNFPSFFYSILAKFITTDQVPGAYLLLYLLSRFFLFFWVYKLWHFISKDKFTAAICSLSFILLGRVEEFLYRTFSHQEFALGIIMAGLYFFYKDRFILAAAILGLAANFHLVYSLFPMIYLNVFLLIFRKDRKWETILKSNGIFLLLASPVVILAVQKYFGGTPAVRPSQEEWLPLYYLACPQNFIFNATPLHELTSSLKVFFTATREYIFLFLLYLINIIFFRPFEKDHKIYAMSVSAVTMLAISFIFTYVAPNRFIIDLNLIRNVQYLLFFYAGYTVVLLADTVTKRGAVAGLICGFLLMLLRVPSLDHFTQPYLQMALIISGLLFLNLAAGFIKKLSPWMASQKRLFLIIPLVVVFCTYSLFHVRYLKIVHTGGGFWQMQRNWIDIQKYAKEHTPKNALFLIPNDTEMGGFRIYAERPIVVCYRDCGIVGFDYRAVVDWQKRLNDVENFKVLIRGDLQKAIFTALVKYKVNYIIFMNYAQPNSASPILEKLYENEVFALYKVLSNPL